MAVSEDFYARTRLLLHDEGVERLRSSHVLVVGLGGVGGYAAEQLCRAGVGHLTLVDGDVVGLSNVNRQIIALQSTVGLSKAELFRDRFFDINPDCQVRVVNEYIRDERMVELLESEHFDFVVDAIDTLSPKVFLLFHAHRLQIPIVSSMGSAGKLDPLQVQSCDIAKSHTCPLAAMVRKRLHHLGVREGIHVVFSTEKVAADAMIEERGENKRTTLGVISYLPAVFGCVCASVVLRELLKNGAINTQF